MSLFEKKERAFGRIYQGNKSKKEMLQSCRRADIPEYMLPIIRENMLKTVKSEMGGNVFSLCIAIVAACFLAFMFFLPLWYCLHRRLKAEMLKEILLSE